MITPKSVAATSSVLATSLFSFGPGPCTVAFANAGTAATVFIGPGTGVTTSNGFPVPSGVTPLVLPIPAGSAGQQWSVITASGSATLQMLISSPTGQTGTGTLG